MSAETANGDAAAKQALTGREERRRIANASWDKHVYTDGYDTLKVSGVGEGLLGYPAEGVRRGSAQNVWGTTKSDVGEGFCPDCERADSPNNGRQHYNNCSTRVAR